MGVNSLPCITGFVPHYTVNGDLVCTGRIQAAAEGVAAFVDGVLHPDELHHLSPKNVILAFADRLSVVLEKIRSAQAGHHQGKYAGVDRHQAIFSRASFRAALDRLLLQIDIFTADGEQLRNTKARV